MATMQTIDAVFLLIVTAHAVIMINRDESHPWTHFVGRVCLSAVGFFAFSVAIERLSTPPPEMLDFWTRLGLDASIAVFIVFRVWFPWTTPNLIYNSDG
jgi:hypothetical protein